MRKILPLAVLLIALFVPGNPNHCTAQDVHKERITLQEALQRALRSHENIQVARIQWELAGLLPAKAVSMVLPHANSQATLVRNKEGVLLDTAAASDSGVPADIEPRTQWRGEFNIVQPAKPEVLPAYFSGKELEASEKENYRFALRQILFLVVRTYFDCLKQEKLLEVVQENLQLASQQADVSRRRFEAGEVPRTDYLRASVEVARAQRNRLDTQNRRDLAYARLKSLVGIGQDSDIEVQEPSASGMTLPSLEEARHSAQDRRNDLKQQAHLADQAAWELKRAYAKFIPSFDLEFKELLVDPESFSDRNNFWTLLLKFNWSALEGTDRFLEVREKRLRLEQEKFRYERLKKDILLQVQDTWSVVQTLSLTLKVTTEELASADEDYRATAERYRAGDAASVDVSDTFAHLVSARSDLTNLTYDYQTALYDLERVMGLFADEYISR